MGYPEAPGEDDEEFNRHWYEGLVGFEGEAEGGGQGDEGAGQDAAEGDGGGDEIGQDQEDEEVVALAEVAGGDCAEYENESEGESIEVWAGEGEYGDSGLARIMAGGGHARITAVLGRTASEEEIAGGHGGRACDYDDCQLEAEGEREVEQMGQGDDRGGEPDGERRVGFEAGGAVWVEVRGRPMKHSFCGEQEPELVVAGLGQQR